MAYIEVIGAMGTGKTSLTEVFNQKARITTIAEQEDDLKRLFFVEPYLSNPEKFGFEGILNFLAFHLNRIKDALHKLPEGSDVVVDTSLLMQYAYAKGTMTDKELDVISDVIEIASKKLPQVDLRIVLTLPPDVHLERVRKRGRNTEGSVTKEFLKAVQDNLQEAVVRFGDGVPTLYLDGSRLDWVNNEADKETVMKLVRQKLPKLG